MSENFDQIRELLAARRQHVPSESYFDGFVERLHQRQRADELKSRRSFWGKLVALPETFAAQFEFTTPVRVAVPAMAAAVLLAFGILMAPPATEAPSFAALSLDQPKAGLVAFAEDFAPAPLLASPALETASQAVDEIPHYVMAQAPSSVDTVVAF
ncbi:MAG: hypothetical protein AAGK14_07795 [Verrucomicrobiota bacterium]